MALPGPFTVLRPQFDYPISPKQPLPSSCHHPDATDSPSMPSGYLLYLQRLFVSGQLQHFPESVRSRSPDRCGRTVMKHWVADCHCNYRRAFCFHMRYRCNIRRRDLSACRGRGDTAGRSESFLIRCFAHFLAVCNHSRL